MCVRAHARTCARVCVWFVTNWQLQANLRAVHMGALFTHVPRACAHASAHPHMHQLVHTQTYAHTPWLQDAKLAVAHEVQAKSLTTPIQPKREDDDDDDCDDDADADADSDSSAVSNTKRDPMAISLTEWRSSLVWP